MKRFKIETDKFEVGLGEKIEAVINRLKALRIRYTTPFEGLTNNSTTKETVMNVPEYGIELIFENDEVTYIKSGNSGHNIICNTDIGNVMSMADIQQLLDSIANKFSLSSKEITIRHINLKRVDAVVLIARGDKRIRVHLLCDLSGNVYISTLKIIDK